MCRFTSIIKTLNKRKIQDNRIQCHEQKFDTETIHIRKFKLKYNYKYRAEIRKTRRITKTLATWKWIPTMTGSDFSFSNRVYVCSAVSVAHVTLHASKTRFVFTCSVRYQFVKLWKLTENLLCFLWDWIFISVNQILMTTIQKFYKG